MLVKTGELKPENSKCDCGKIAKITYTDKDGPHAYCEECYEKKKAEIPT